MRKTYRCRECGKEENYEIDGSWFFVSSFILAVFFFITSLELGTIFGLMAAGVIGTVAPEWKVITAFIVLMLVLWTFRAGQKWLPEQQKIILQDPKKQ